MDAPKNEASVPQERGKERKRSPWLVVLIILLVTMMCCCITGAVLCWGGAMLPDFLAGYVEDIPGLEDTDNIWELIEEIINDPDFDPGDFDPEDFLPEDFGTPDVEGEFNDSE